MTPSERAEAWHDRYRWKTTGLPVDAAAIAGLAKTIREAEYAAYARVAAITEGYALAEDELVKAARRNADHRDAAIHGYACGEFQAAYITIRALEHGDSHG